jgi:hypothetical protein
MQGHGAKHVFENFIFPTVFVNAACWVAQPEYAFGAWQVPPTAAHPRKQRGFHKMRAFSVTDFPSHRLDILRPNLFRICRWP